MPNILQKAIPILSLFAVALYVIHNPQILYQSSQAHLKKSSLQNQEQSLNSLSQSLISLWNKNQLKNINVTVNSQQQDLTFQSFKSQYGQILDVVTKDYQFGQLKVLIIFQDTLAIGEATMIFQQSTQKLMSIAINADSFYSYANFLLQNANISGTVGFTLIKNNQKVLDINGNHDMGLQGIEKSLTMVEFAKQIGEGKLNRNALVNISHIERFRSPCAYLQFGDSYQPIPVNTSNSLAAYYADEGFNAQVGYWNQTHKLINNTFVTLEDVAFAVTNFTSRPCTEYLQGVVGINNLNNEIKILGMNNTKNLTFINSMEYSLTNYNNLSRSEYMSYLKNFTYDDMLREGSIIHDVLSQGVDNKYFTQCLENNEAFSMLISPEFLYPSCSNDYASVFEKINKGNYFGSVTQKLLLQLFSIEFPNNTFEGHKFEKIGWKAGVGDFAETDNMLTFGLYFTDLQGNSTNYVLFLNKLFRQDFEKLFFSQHNFNLVMSTSQLYLDNLINKLQKVSVSQ